MAEPGGAAFLATFRATQIDTPLRTAWYGTIGHDAGEPCQYTNSAPGLAVGRSGWDGLGGSRERRSEPGEDGKRAHLAPRRKIYQ